MSFWRTLFGRAQPQPAGASPSPTGAGTRHATAAANPESRCCTCSDLWFLSDWIGKSARCSECGQLRVLTTSRGSWKAYVMPTADEMTQSGMAYGIAREQTRAASWLRQSISMLLAEPQSRIWIVNFESGAAVHTYIDTMRGAAFPGIVPSTTVAMPVVRSSESNWQDYLERALSVISASTGDASIVVAATDSSYEFLKAVRACPIDLDRLRLIGYE